MQFLNREFFTSRSTVEAWFQRSLAPAIARDEYRDDELRVQSDAKAYMFLVSPLSVFRHVVFRAEAAH